MVFQLKGFKPLTERVTLRLAPDEKERLQVDADLAGLSVSEVIRRHYFGRPIIANADAAMIRELRRMGGLMKHLHTESGGMYSAQTGAALNSIVYYIDKLAAR